MCESPFNVRLHKDRFVFDKINKVHVQSVPVPCGKCPHCLHRRINQWAFRLEQERLRAVSAYFVTLTYESHNLPRSPNGFQTLCKKDLQHYFMRLRKIARNEIRRYPHYATREMLKYGERPISFFACGEYGSINRRPHYHAIILNASAHDIINAWKLKGREIGMIHLGEVNTKTITYTLKYINKQEKNRPKYQRYDAIKQFQTMSRDIGSNYLTPQRIRWHRNNLDNNFVINQSSYKVALPKYYKEKIYGEIKDKDNNIIQHCIKDKLTSHIASTMQTIHAEKEKELKRKLKGTNYTIDQYKRMSQEKRYYNYHHQLTERDF